MRSLVVLAVLVVVCACEPAPQVPVQPDAAALAAAEADPVYQQHRRKFNVSFQAGDHGRALDHAKQALRTAVVLREPYVWVSTLCNQMGRNQEAIRFFREITEEHPDLALPWFYKGFNEFHLSLFDDALESFGRAGELDPGHAETWYRQAMIRYTRSEFDTVVELLEKSYALDPLAELTVTSLVDVLRMQGDEERAAAVVEEGLSSIPRSAAIVYRSGLSALNRGDDAAAERTFLHALELDPTMRQPYEHLAALHSRTGREDESRRYRNISTRLNEYRRNSRLLASRMVDDTVDGAIPLLLAEVELTAGKTEVALGWFKRAMRLGGYIERNAAGQAEALFRLGRVEEGNRMLGAARDGSARVRLAHVARELATGNREAALEALERALERPPNEAQFLRRASDYAAEAGDIARSDALLERSILAETLSTAPDPDEPAS